MIRKIQKNEIPQVAKMLARAFDGYAEMQALFGGMEAIDEFVTGFFEDQMHYIFNRGDIYVTEDLQAAYYGYDSATFSFWRLLFHMAITTSKRVSKLSKADRRILGENAKRAAGTQSAFWYRKFVKGRHYHFMILGVDPAAQCKGYGKELLSKVMTDCDEKHIPIILDTHCDKNVGIYSRYGFAVAKEYVSKDGKLTRHCMVRKPSISI